ncbi:MAG: hypothetical protein LBQ32_10075 [Burkholderiaceae bacterium]|jgi:hypothetical protein|nr:hypothetical protein [Burkholderiaceae bacterium]
MFPDTDDLEGACPVLDLPDVSRTALALIKAMTGCCHPRAKRLAERLLACGQPEELQHLQGEVLNLLALSFGTAEAQRRLHRLQ